ncbi:MAG TPA: hypothetical protein VGL86_00255 [Polyangia bacterium]
MSARVSGRVVDAVAFAAVAVLMLSMCAALTSHFVLDVDDVNLALAIEHFDVRMHQAHPPGYLGYVLLLRGVHRLVAMLGGGGFALVDVARWTARGFSLVTIWMSARAARALGGDDTRARLAALLVAANPIVLYYAVDGQTHAAEAAMAAALLWALADRRRPWLVGLLVAAGASFRPTYLVLAGPAVLWAYFGQWRRLAVVAAIAAAGTLAWLLPSVRLTGGWAAYRAANDALVGELIGRASLLSATKNAHNVALNLRDTLAWALIALFPLVVVRRAVNRRALALGAAMVLPALVFYAVVLCAEAGYLAGLVAPAAVLAALGARRPALGCVIAVAELAFFLGAPQEIGGTFMLPDVQEIVSRDVRAATLFDALHRDLPADARVLVISDFPDLTAMRQQPIVRPATDVLFVHDKTWFPAGGESWLSYATAHGWWAAPPIVLRGDGNGDPRVLVAKQPFRWIVLDPRASRRLRAELQAQTRCTVAAESDTETRTAQRWPRDCFGDELRFYELAFRFTK